MTGAPAEERSDAVGRERNPSNQYQIQYLSPLWATYPKSPVLSPLRGLVFVMASYEGLRFAPRPRYRSAASARLFSANHPPQTVIPGKSRQRQGPRNPPLAGIAHPRPSMKRDRSRRSLNRHPPRALPGRTGFRDPACWRTPPRNDTAAEPSSIKPPEGRPPGRPKARRAL